MAHFPSPYTSPGWRRGLAPPSLFTLNADEVTTKQPLKREGQTSRTDLRQVGLGMLPYTLSYLLPGLTSLFTFLRSTYLYLHTYLPTVPTYFRPYLRAYLPLPISPPFSVTHFPISLSDHSFNPYFLCVPPLSSLTSSVSLSLIASPRPSPVAPYPVFTRLISPSLVSCS